MMCEESLGCKSLLDNEQLGQVSKFEHFTLCWMKNEKIMQSALECCE